MVRISGSALTRWRRVTSLSVLWDCGWCAVGGREMPIGREPSGGGGERRFCCKRICAARLSCASPGKRVSREGALLANGHPRRVSPDSCCAWHQKGPQPRSLMSCQLQQVLPPGRCGVRHRFDLLRRFSLSQLASSPCQDRYVRARKKLLRVVRPGVPRGWPHAIAGTPRPEGTRRQPRSPPRPASPCRLRRQHRTAHRIRR